MSKKTNSKKVSDKNINDEKEPKKSGKAIIAAAVSVVVIAAVLVGIFVVKPAIDKRTEPTTVPVVTNPPVEGEMFTYADYKGTRMPVEFIEILNQAEIDSKKACDEYGVALRVGERNISKSEFSMYYLDQYYLQLNEINYSIEQRGSNMTGYNPEVLPDAQNAVGVDYTFAEDFTRKAIELIQTNYASFDLAIQNKTQLDEAVIDTTMVSYQRLETYVKLQDEEISIDEYVANFYGDGMTYAMFAAREIMQAYARVHEETTAQKYFEDVSIQDAEERLKGNETKYMVVKSRVYPIEGAYEPEEISSINTEEEFLAFAKKNYPSENYIPEYKTLGHYVTYGTVERTYGTDVADWMFSEDRVPGEISVVQGEIYECLVYIEKPAFLDTSCDIITYEYTYPEGQSEEEFQMQADEIQQRYDSWVERKLSEEEFRKECLATGFGFEKTYRTGDFFFAINSWILDDKRKSGDLGIFNDGTTVYIVYYCHNNPEDFDWNEKIRTELSAERYLNEYNAFIEEHQQIRRYENVIVQSQKSMNVKITQNINKTNNKK